jgi:hypothetical protein
MINPKPMEHQKTVGELIDEMLRDGGIMASSAECTIGEISVAQEEGRFAINSEGLGFVLFPAPMCPEKWKKE